MQMTVKVNLEVPDNWDEPMAVNAIRAGLMELYDWKDVRVVEPEHEQASERTYQPTTERNRI